MNFNRNRNWRDEYNCWQLYKIRTEGQKGTPYIQGQDVNSFPLAIHR